MFDYLLKECRSQVTATGSMMETCDLRAEIHMVHLSVALSKSFCSVQPTLSGNQAPTSQSFFGPVAHSRPLLICSMRSSLYAFPSRNIPHAFTPLLSLSVTLLHFLSGPGYTSPCPEFPEVFLLAHHLGLSVYGQSSHEGFPDPTVQINPSVFSWQ